MECPFCRRRAQKQIEGVKVDVCEDHGIWLDKGEKHRWNLPRACGTFHTGTDCANFMTERIIEKVLLIKSTITIGFCLHKANLVGY